MATKLYYHAHKNPGGAGLPGVPLRDISDEEYQDYPEWIQRSLDHDTSFYYKSKPRVQKEEEEGDEPKAATTKGKTNPTKKSKAKGAKSAMDTHTETTVTTTNPAPAPAPAPTPEPQPQPAGAGPVNITVAPHEQVPVVEPTPGLTSVPTVQGGN